MFMTERSGMRMPSNAQMLALAAAVASIGIHDESCSVPRDSEPLRELKPDPAFGLASEEQKNTKPPKRGKGTRRSRSR
jgi:hypothetical protein